MEFNSQKLVTFLGSLKLAVILLVGFVILLSVATFYESYTSTEAAQRLIYNTYWFDLLLLLLGVNVLCSTFTRLPWKMHHFGFLITHLGILVILFGALITRGFGIEGQIMLEEGEKADSISINEPTLTVHALAEDKKDEFDPWFLNRQIPNGKEIRYDVNNTGLTCFIDRYIQNPKIVEEVTNDATRAFPALQVTLFIPNTTNQFQDWLFAKAPMRKSLDLNVAKISFHGQVSADKRQTILSAEKSNNHIDFFLSENQDIDYHAVNQAGKTTAGTIAVGEQLDPKWNGILVRVDQFYPNARIAEEIIETPTPSADMHLNPVIHVRLQSGEQNTEGYVVYNSPKTFLVGQESATVYFGQRQRPLGFTIQLLDFRAPRYPGTNRPASFESDVMLIDESQQIERKQRIFMNNPLYHNNYAVYQSSYIEGRNGQPDTSIFTVARAPGTPVIYIGSVIMILGMIFLIYQKGGLKKQKQNPTSS